MLRAIVAFTCLTSQAQAFMVAPRVPHAKTVSTASATAALAAAPQQPSATVVSTRAHLERLQMVAGPLKIGVVGVTGAVGQEIISVLGNREFPVSELKLFASARSAGQPMATPFGEKTIEEFTLEAARECDVVFLAVSGDFALEWVPQITADDGPLVIDNSSAYRYDDDVPLVVPEINAEAARKSKKRIVANPNCTTAIALMALAPLHKEFGIKRCIMSTYQAASGAGAPGMTELQEGAAAMANGGTAKNSVFAHPLPFNVIPHIDKFLDDQYTKEERKVRGCGAMGTWGSQAWARVHGGRKHGHVFVGLTSMGTCSWGSQAWARVRGVRKHGHVFMGLTSMGTCSWGSQAWAPVHGAHKHGHLFMGLASMGTCSWGSQASGVERGAWSIGRAGRGAWGMGMGIAWGMGMGHGTTHQSRREP